MTTRLKNGLAAVVAVAGLLTMIGCAKTKAAGNPAPPEVEVAVVAQKDLPIVREWIGTLDGMVNAAIKAQVTGYLLTQNYAEGRSCTRDNCCLRSTRGRLQAALRSGQGATGAGARRNWRRPRQSWCRRRRSLLSAEANQQKAQLDEDRYVPLAQQQAITQQDLDNARQNNQSLQGAGGGGEGAGGDREGADRGRAGRGDGGRSGGRDRAR